MPDFAPLKYGQCPILPPPSLVLLPSTATPLRLSQASSRRLGLSVNRPRGGQRLRADRRPGAHSPRCLGSPKCPGVWVGPPLSVPIFLFLAVSFLVPKNFALKPKGPNGPREHSGRIGPPQAHRALRNPVWGTGGFTPGRPVGPGTPKASRDYGGL